MTIASIRAFTDDSFDWDQNPHLIDAEFALPTFSHHARTGIALFTVVARGQWPRRALAGLGPSLAALLPGRWDLFAAGRGSVRITICLGQAPALLNARREHVPSDMSHAPTVLIRTWGGLTRMVADAEGYPVDPPAASSQVAPLSPLAGASFMRALDELGTTEFIGPADRIGADGTEPWFKLRHSWRQSVSDWEQWCYDWKWPRSSGEVAAMLAQCE